MRTQRHVCQRCTGMMVEIYSDLLSPNARGEDVFVWHCVNCGDYVDRRVLLNRWAQQGAPPLPLRLVRSPEAHHRSQPLSIHRRQAAA
ncbi:MAG: hypothetical protein U0236_04905 [Nitrospira sp.]